MAALNVSQGKNRHKHSEIAGTAVLVAMVV